MENPWMACPGPQGAATHSSYDHIGYDGPLAVATFQDLFDKRWERISPKALKTSSAPTATCWRKGDTPKRLSELRMIRRKSVPNKVPSIVPAPP